MPLVEDREFTFAPLPPVAPPAAPVAPPVAAAPPATPRPGYKRPALCPLFLSPHNSTRQFFLIFPFFLIFFYPQPLFSCSPAWTCFDYSTVVFFCALPFPHSLPLFLDSNFPLNICHLYSFVPKVQDFFASLYWTLCITSPPLYLAGPQVTPDPKTAHWGGGS